MIKILMLKNNMLLNDLYIVVTGLKRCFSFSLSRVSKTTNVNKDDVTDWVVMLLLIISLPCFVHNQWFLFSYKVGHQTTPWHLLQLWPPSRKVRPPQPAPAGGMWVSITEILPLYDEVINALLFWFMPDWTLGPCVLPSDLWPFYPTAPLPPESVGPPTLAAGFRFHTAEMQTFCFLPSARPFYPIWVEILNGGVDANVTYH